MHKDDQMTSKERTTAFYAGKDIDRLPAMPFVVSGAGKFCGMTHREKRSCAKNQAGAQIAAYKALGTDNICIEYGLYGIGAACGTKKSDPEDRPQTIDTFVMESLDDLGKLDVDMVSRKNDSWSAMNCEACEIAMEEVGQEVDIFATIPGPFTAAASLLPVEKLLRATRREPEKLHQLLRFCTDAAKIVIDDFMAAGAGPFLSDPIASNDLISVKNYREFVFPYTKELMDYVHAKGAGMGYHVCGETTQMIPELLDTGCNSISLDSNVDLAYLKEKTGDRAMICSNVDVLKSILYGTKEDVYENVKDNLRKAWDAPGGLAISTSCDIPMNAPLENIYAFMDGVRKYAKWPLNPDNFM